MNRYGISTTYRHCLVDTLIMDEAAGIQENVAADVSLLRETSQCAGVSLLDVGSISFDSFLATSATLIPQFIFDSLDVMQHDKRLATSTSCEYSSTDSCSSPSEVSHMTTSLDQISPSKQILELICGIDVADHCEQSDTEPDDNRQTHSQQVITAEFSDSTLSSPDNASVSDSPGTMNTAYYESPDLSGNDNMTCTPSSAIANSPRYNTAVKTPSFLVHKECSVESISSLGGTENHLEHKTAVSNQETSSAECLLFLNSIYPREANPSSSDDACSVESASPLSQMDTLTSPAMISSPVTHPTESLFLMSREKSLQTREAAPFLNHPKEIVQPAAYFSRIAHLPERGMAKISNQNSYAVEPLLSLKPVEVPSTRVATQDTPQAEVLSSSQWTDKLLMRAVPTSSSYLGRVPGNFSTPCYINVQPTSPQTLLLSDVPRASMTSSRSTPTLSPTESESSESEFGAKRKNRTNYSTKQLRILEKGFLENPYPDTEQIAALANDLDLTVAKLRIWFQNKRARWRKRTKDNETSAHPIYQPPLPFAISSWPQQAPVSIPSVPNRNQTSIDTSLAHGIKPFGDVDRKPGRMVLNENHLSLGQQYPSHRQIPNVPACLPIVPTAVRYNSKLLTSAVLSELPRAGGRIPVNLPQLLCKASPGTNTTSESTSIYGQPYRGRYLENIHQPNMYQILPRQLHPTAHKMASPFVCDDYKNMMYNLPKNPLGNPSSNMVGYERYPEIPVPPPSGFQPYVPHMYPFLPPYGSQQRVPPYYRT